jgi:hypothetical protein
MMDTEYTTIPCRPSALPKEYHKIYDIEDMLSKEVPSYEDAQEILDKYLGIEGGSSKPKKKKKKKSSDLKTKTSSKKKPTSSTKKKKTSKK